MLASDPLPHTAVSGTESAMPRAHTQLSWNNKKLPGDQRIGADMQTSTHTSAPRDGFAAVRAGREFDFWLQRELCRLHGDVLHEPIPEKLLRILEDGATPRD
jgi:hypothetical protein